MGDETPEKRKREESPDTDQSKGPDSSIMPSEAGSWEGTLLDMSMVPKSGTDHGMADGTIMVPASQPELITIQPGMVSGLEKKISDLKAGDKVNRYVIEENPYSETTAVIGEGASGKIYRALQVGLQRRVALKFLKGDNPPPDALPEVFDKFKSALEQFQGEARAIVQLQGKNILQVYDLDEWNGNMYIAMELLEGGSAKERMEKQFGTRSDSGFWKKIGNTAKRVLKKEEQTAEPKAKEYIVNQQDIEYYVNTTIQVAEQLQVAHNNGILHRDIKPGNIMYRDKEQKEAVLVDYGLAMFIKAEQTGTAGTPGFMAPEQVDQKGVLNERTDVYNLGATLYNMLTNKSVHNFEKDKTWIGVITNGVTTDISRLNKSVDRNLAAIVHKAVEKDPNKRYESAKAFSDDLKRWRDGRRVVAKPCLSLREPTSYLSLLPTSRRLKKRGLLWGITTAVSGTLIYLASALYKAQEPERMRNERVANYISEINSRVSVADSLSESANRSYEILRQKSLVEMLHENVEISSLAKHQKTIGDVFNSYSRALSAAKEWMKDDLTSEKKSEEKRRELDVLVKNFEEKNEYAVQKISAYEMIVEAGEAYKSKDFAKTEKALASALDRLYEADTQKELVRVQKEHSVYQKQRTMQGVRDIAERVRGYRSMCRACFMDDIAVFSGREEDITPESGTEWKKLMTGIEGILRNPDDEVLRKIQLDAKTYEDLIGQARADAKEAFDSERSILKNTDVKRALDMKRNKAADDKYMADLRDMYTSGKIGDDEYRLRMRLPLPSQREKFIEALEKEFKKGVVPKQLYDKLRSQK